MDPKLIVVATMLLCGLLSAEPPKEMYRPKADAPEHVKAWFAKLPELRASQARSEFYVKMRPDENAISGLNSERFRLMDQELPKKNRRSAQRARDARVKEIDAEISKLHERLGALYKQEAERAGDTSWLPIPERYGVEVGYIWQSPQRFRAWRIDKDRGVVVAWVGNTSELAQITGVDTSTLVDNKEFSLDGAWHVPGTVQVGSGVAYDVRKFDPLLYLERAPD